MHNQLVPRIKAARAWLAENTFPTNPLTKEIRKAGAFTHRGARIPSRHRSTDELCDLISALIVTENLKNVLEVGTLFGYSTLHLAEAVSIVGGKVTSVDLRVPSRTWEDGQIVENIHEAAITHIDQSGLKPFVDLVSGNSCSVLPTFIMDAREFDIIFLDGSHSRYVFTLDLINSAELISDNGIIILDDIGEVIAVKSFHYGGPNSVLPTIWASGRFDMLALSANTMIISKKRLY